jgi:hypothetical protein
MICNMDTIHRLLIRTITLTPFNLISKTIQQIRAGVGVLIAVD